MSGKKSHAVGIDLGTTYSCIAWLNEHGQPVTIANQEGELATPSVVFLDGNDVIVGTEALRNAIAHPDRVIQNAKRYMGEPNTRWQIGNAILTPEFVSSRILTKLLNAASTQLGPIAEAVITVPAQFSDAQRHATIRAGHAAGLEKVEIINEPVAAALCHVLGSEGLAFTELAIDQQLLIFDLGGGTLDLSVVNYTNDEVKVVASDGDLELGGLDWTDVLVDTAADRFLQEFKEDPRLDPESHQALMLEAEQAKRSLSVRPRAAITVQHGGNRQTWQIEQDEFERLSRKLLRRAAAITRRILSDNKLGWAHIDVLLTTGGASRMPMIKAALQKISGRTLNSTLSPDQSIAHGAAYYAGMLLSNSSHARTVFSSQASKRLSKIRQQSVNARSLGIMIRDTTTGERVPHYIVPPNSPLPIARSHVFGTVVDSQTNVHVRIVESGAGPDKPPTELGECHISDLPPGLPEGSQVEVMISYDTQARVHVSARELSTNASTEVEFIRQENIAGQLQDQNPVAPPAAPPVKSKPAPPAADNSSKKSQPADQNNAAMSQELLTSLGKLADLSKKPEPKTTDQPAVQESPSEEIITLRCRACDTPLNQNGECDNEECISASQAVRNWVATNEELQPPQDSSGELEFWNLVEDE